ncbi:MAG: hypothetical protein KAI76_01985 [Alphaproteobacteria bacterium]|nr:hypothetical protein [Alphaproteobacteria bacterium]
MAHRAFLWVDLGYRGHGVKDENIEIILAHKKRGITPAKRKHQKRRSAIEPIIGHCKNDRKVGPRNWLRGKTDDQINALAIATGFNLRKILRWIFLRLLTRLLTIQKIFALPIARSKAAASSIKLTLRTFSIIPTNVASHSRRDL